MERKHMIEKLQLRDKQIVLLPFVRFSEEIIQTDGKMNDPSAEVTCWLAFSLLFHSSQTIIPDTHSSPIHP